MTSRYDLLDQYIDARNAGRQSVVDTSGDLELAQLIDTIEEIDGDGHRIEWPDDSFPTRMANRLAVDLDPHSRVRSLANGAVLTSGDDVTLDSPGGTGVRREPERRGTGWYLRQFTGMAAAALVVALLAGGLAILYGEWGDRMQEPGATMVEPGDLPGMILYVEYEPSAREQTIARVNADGTDQRTLATRPTLLADIPGVAWSPDGTSIAYVEAQSLEERSPVGVTVVDLERGETLAFEQAAVNGSLRLDSALDWSHDGNSLAFVYFDDETDRTRISTVSLETGGFQTIDPDGNGAAPNDRNPKWAPNQWSLAFIRVQEGGRSGIYLMYEGMTEPIPLFDGGSRAVQPEWSPDGESIAYVGEGEDPSLGNLHVVDVDSGRSKNITNHDRTDYLPVWSSRDQIAFMSDFADRNHDIFVVYPDGSGLRNLTGDHDWRFFQPDWSDDGRYLTFTSTNQDEDEWRLNVYDVETDELYTVLESDNPLHHAQWRPEAHPDDSNGDEPDIDVSELSEEQLDLLRQRAEMFLHDGDDPTVLTVNGEAITAQQIASREASVLLGMSTMREVIDEQGTMSPEVVAYREAMIELFNEYGAVNVGLGMSLARTVVQVFAEENNLLATENQIAEAVERQRDSYEMLELRDPEAAAAVGEGQIKGLIDVIGEERYWEEYLPKVMSESITEQNVDQAIWEARNNENDADPSTIGLERDLFLAEFRADLVRDAQIEVVDEAALGGAELDRAFEYITEAYPELIRQQAEQRVGQREQGFERAVPLPADARVSTAEEALEWFEREIEQYDVSYEVVSIDLVTIADMEAQRGPQPRYTDKSAPVWRVEIFGQRVPAPDICRDAGPECLEERVATAYWIAAEDGSHLGMSTAPTSEELSEPADETDVFPINSPQDAEQRALEIANELGFPGAEVLDVESMTAAEMEAEQEPYFPDIADMNATVWRVELNDVLDEAMRMHCPNDECPDDASTVYWLDEASGSRIAYTFHGLE